MAIGLRDDQLDLVVTGYIAAMLWSSVGDNDESLEDYKLGELTLSKARAICQAFIIDADKDKEPLRPLDHYITFIRTCTEFDEYEMLGHDLWLTSAGEGAGFWDRDLGEVGEILTEIASKYARDCYLSDDLVYIY